MGKQEFEELLFQAFCWLHQHPELGFEEYETTKHIKEILREHGIRILDLPMKTGLVAEIGRGGPTIALRADIDALPVTEETELPYRSLVSGRMHACGHDFHTTTMLGAAILLKERETELPGTVRMIFQPAEEVSGGARAVLDTGVLRDVRFICGLHVLPSLPVGTLGLKAGAASASVDRFWIRIIGKGTHAAHPDDGTDPIVAAACLISAAQTIVSRNVDPSSANLISFTHVEGGNTWNVIPSEVFLEGTIRSLSKTDRAFLKRRLSEMTDSIGKAYGTRTEMDWYEGPPPTDNDSEWIAAAAALAKERGFTVTVPHTTLIGEDFAFYQEELTGVFAFVGTGLGPSIHSPKFQADPKAIAPASEYFAAMAETALRRIVEREA